MEIVIFYLAGVFMKKDKENPKKLFFQGTAILSVAALLTKILSAFYRVPFQNIVGDVGFYIYQQVYPFYGIAVSLATYGFPIVISKIYAEKLEMRSKSNAERYSFPVFFSVTMFCFALFLVIYIGSPFFAKQMGDSRLEPLLKMVAFIFFIIPLTSVIRGYFQGRGYMVPTAFSQVGEQLTRVSLILILSFILVKKGFSLYEVGKWAMFASVTGSLCALLILISFFVRHFKNGQTKFIKNIKDSFPVMKTIWTEGIAICISGLTLLFFQLADSFQILSLLKHNGMVIKQAQIVKGIYDRGQPLIQLGMVLATSLSLSVVPLVTVVKRKRGELINYIRLAFQISLSVSSAAALGLILIMRYLNTMLFENQAGTNVLRIFVMTIVFATICTTVISILQGLGVIFYPAFVVLAGFFIKIICNQIFISEWGTYGAAISSNLSLLVMAILLIYKLKKAIQVQLFSKHFIRVCLSSLAIMTVTILIFFMICTILSPITNGNRIFSTIVSISAALIGAFVFLIKMIRGGVFTEEELVLLPFGGKLQSLFRKRRGSL
jgi:O-antigen/teichoic acid export membrane protein